MPHQKNARQKRKFGEVQKYLGNKKSILHAEEIHCRLKVDSHYRARHGTTRHGTTWKIFLYGSDMIQFTEARHRNVTTKTAKGRFTLYGTARHYTTRHGTTWKIFLYGSDMIQFTDARHRNVTTKTAKGRFTLYGKARHDTTRHDTGRHEKYSCMVLIWSNSQKPVTEM
jgi:hypothetical protein